MKTDKIWTATSAVASAVAAIAAFLAIYQASLIFKAEREVRRPYLKIVKALMQKRENDKNYEFKIVLENIGINPLRDPKMKLLVKNHSLDEDLFGVAYAFADEIPTGGTLNFYRKNIKPNSKEEDLYYVILAVRYFDPILDKEFAQIFLHQWRSKSNMLERVLIPQRDNILEDQSLKLPLVDSNIIQQIWKTE